MQALTRTKCDMQYSSVNRLVAAMRAALQARAKKDQADADARRMQAQQRSQGQYGGYHGMPPSGPGHYSAPVPGHHGYGGPGFVAGHMRSY
jgi:hypothetical protein